MREAKERKDSETSVAMSHAGKNHVWHIDRLLLDVIEVPSISAQIVVVGTHN